MSSPKIFDFFFWQKLDQTPKSIVSTIVSKYLCVITPATRPFGLNLNTSYLTDSYTVFTLKMESQPKNIIFGLKMMVKSDLEKFILNSLHAGRWLLLLLNFEGKNDVWTSQVRRVKELLNYRSAQNFVFSLGEYINSFKLFCWLRL